MAGNTRALSFPVPALALAGPLDQAYPLVLDGRHNAGFAQEPHVHILPMATATGHTIGLGNPGPGR